MEIQELVSAMKANLEEYGMTSGSAGKVTSRQIVEKLAAFKQVARALNIKVPFDMDTANDAADELAEWVNACIDAANE